MYDFGAEEALRYTEEPWGFEITLIIYKHAVPAGAPSEISGEVTGFFRDFGNRVGVFFHYEDDEASETVHIPIDVISGYRIAELPDDWPEEDRQYLFGDRAGFLEMVNEDVEYLMRDNSTHLTEACFSSDENILSSWADLVRKEAWRRACPDVRGWYQNPEIFLVVGLAATLDIDIAVRAVQLRRAFENMQAHPKYEASAVDLAQVPADIDGMHQAARTLNYEGILPMRGVLFSLLAMGGEFGPETAAALRAIEEGFEDRYAYRDRSGMYY